MPPDYNRNNGGKFSETVEDSDILHVFAASNDPVLTASEVASELPLTRQAITHRLKQLHAAGRVGRKKVGSRAVVWWVAGGG